MINNVKVISREKPQTRIEGKMESIWLTLFWTGPIGIGVFLAGLGVLFWGISYLRNPNKK